MAPALLRALTLVIAPSAAFAAFAAAPSAAEAAENSSIVVYIEGQDADATRDEILAIVPSGVRVVDADAFTDALKKAGHKGQMGNMIAIAKQRAGLLAKIRKATGAVGAGAAIIGRIRKTRTLSREVWLLYLKAAGELSVDEAVPLPDSGGERKSGLKKVLDGPLGEIAGPQSTTPDKGVETPGAGGTPGNGDGDDGDDGDDSDDGSPIKRHDVANAAVIGELNFQTGGRSFGYSDGLTSNLRPYDVFGAPMVRAAIELYPLAIPRNIPIGRDIGLVGSFTMALGLTSATQGGEPIKNTWMRVGGGLRGRIRFGDAPSPMLGISATYHLLRFSFDTDPMSKLAVEVPDVAYNLLRFGLDTRIPLGPVALEIDGGFLYPLSSGAVYDRQREASVLGIEGRVGVGIPLATGFELRVMAEYTRFFSAFAPIPGDAYVAGGALDQLIALRLGAAYAY